MSRVFIGTPFFNYRAGGAGDGGPTGADLTGGSKVIYEVQETKLCTPNILPSRIIALRINWMTYGAPGNFTGLGPFPSIGVEVDIPMDAADKLGRIGSVFIDNTNSTIPIYVNFPDTGFTITAPPSTSVWYPVFTNKFRFQIIALNMVAGFVPLTKVFVSNREIGPSVDNEFYNVVPQYIGSPLIQRTNTLTPGFGSPALGDQLTSGFTNTAVVSVVSPWPKTVLAQIPRLSTLGDNMYVSGWEFTLDLFTMVTSVATTAFIVFKFWESNLGSVVARWNICLTSATTTISASNLLLSRLNGMNLKLSGNNGTAFEYIVSVESITLAAGTVTSAVAAVRGNVCFTETTQ